MIKRDLSDPTAYRPEALTIKFSPVGIFLKLFCEKSNQKMC